MVGQSEASDEKFSCPDAEQLSRLAASVIQAKAADPKADTSALEGEIDRLVCGLYGLTEEEISVVAE